MWRAALADDDLRRDAVQPEYDDDGWEPIAVPGHWRSTPGLRRQRRPADLPDPLRAGRRARAAPATGWCSTASSTKATSGSTAPTSATPRATSSPTPTRSPTWPGLAAEHVLVVEVTCAPPEDRTSEAQHHRRLPALGLHRPRLEPGRALATGAGRAHRAGADQPPPGALPRGQRGPSASCQVRAELDSDVRPATSACARRSTTGSSGSSTHGLAKGANQVEWQLRRRPPARCGGRGRSATSRCRPSPSRCTSTTRSATPAPSAPASARSRLHNWALYVNGERLFLKGANLGPDPAGSWPRPRPTSCAATSLLAATPASTWCACTPTSAGPSSTTPPTSSACSSGRTSRCSGATPAAIRHQATRQATAMVDLLGHHPSIVVWCGHNEPLAHRRRARPAARPAGCARAYVAAPVLPTWNRIGARPAGEAGHRAGRRQPARHRPLRCAAPPAAARRHRQPPLLRVVLGRRARPAGLRRHASPAWCASSASSAPRPCPSRPRFMAARALARPRLGRPRRAPRAPEGRLRRPGAAGGLRHLRRLATRHAGLPGGRAEAPGRAPPAAQVPADRGVRHVRAQRLPAGGHVEPARPRPRRQAGLPGAHRGVPAGHRRGRPAAGGPRARGNARPRRRRRERSPRRPRRTPR